MVTWPETIDTGTTPVVAWCSSGKKPTGGGYQKIGAIEAHASAPYSSGDSNGWIVTFESPADDATVTVYVICATVSTAP
jgi:hypothetical protein